MVSKTAPSGPSLYTLEFILLWSVNFFMTASLGSFFLFPLFIKAHGGSEADIGILMGAITISSILGRPWIAQAIDRFGRKRSYMAGVFSLATVPLVYLTFEGDISGYYYTLFGVRVLQGIGIALCFTSGFTMIADLVPPERLNEGVGMFGVTGLVGIALGPAVSEPIIHYYGFDAYFIFIALLSLIPLVLLQFLPDRYRYQKGTTNGLSFFQVLKRKKTAWMALVTVFFGIGLATQNNFVSPFVKSIGLPTISVFFISYSIAAILARVFGSKLADRIGEARVIPWAFVLIAFGYLLLVFVDNSTLLIVSGFIAGLGHGFLFPCLNAQLIRNEPEEIRGKVNGIFTGSLDLGLFTGSVGLGYIGEWFGYLAIFGATFTALIIGLILFLANIRKIAG